jgi:hypothetical protein
MRYDVGLSVAFGLALIFATPALVQAQTPDAQGVAANDGPGGPASWTTGNKLAVGTSAGLDSKVWFTVAKGVTSEVFYPRLDVPNMEDMQYVITDGSTFVDLERATSHAISMPSEKALEYTVTNTDMRPSPKYRITNTYIADPSRDSLVIRTRFESLDGVVLPRDVLQSPSNGPSNFLGFDFKEKFARFEFCSVSTTIGIVPSISEISGENGVIGLNEKRPSAQRFPLLGTTQFPRLTRPPDFLSSGPPDFLGWGPPAGPLFEAPGGRQGSSLRRVLPARWHNET